MNKRGDIESGIKLTALRFQTGGIHQTYFGLHPGVHTSNTSHSRHKITYRNTKEQKTQHKQIKQTRRLRRSCCDLEWRARSSSWISIDKSLTIVFNHAALLPYLVPRDVRSMAIEYTGIWKSEKRAFEERALWGISWIAWLCRSCLFSIEATQINWDVEINRIRGNWFLTPSQPLRLLGLYQGDSV